MKVQPCKVTRGGNSNSNESAPKFPICSHLNGANKKSEWQAVGAFDFWTNADETRVRPSRILLYKRGNLQDDFGWLPCIRIICYLLQLQKMQEQARKARSELQNGPN